MKEGLIFVCVILLAVCINIATKITPDAPSVREARKASDCVPIVFGLAYGTASMDKALAERAPLITNFNEPYAHITMVHSVAIHDYYFLFFGARCLEVTGE